MNSPQHSLPAHIQRRPEDLDAWLGRLFQAELPQPWPAPPALPQRPQTRTWWRRNQRTLALAASVAFLALSFWTLVRSFPEPNKQSLPQFPTGAFGKNLDGPKAPGLKPASGAGLLPAQPMPLPGELRPMQKIVPTPNGGKAHLWELHVPNKRTLVRVEAVTPK